jgi:hypothetical protein
MSSAGRIPAWVIEKQRLEMERKREAERRQKVRQQIAAMCQQIQGEITELVSSGQSAWASEEMEAIYEVLKQSESIDEGDVDDMLKRVSESQAKLGQIGSLAESRKEEKRMALDLRMSQVEGLLIELKSMSVMLTKDDNQRNFRILMSSVEDMVTQVRNKNESQIQEFIDNSRTRADEIREADNTAVVQEEVRRHIVSSLITSMNELGFIVGKPKLIKESGRVAVIGKLSSGRMVRFDVAEQGEMEFDMEGFSDRKCADHLDDVLGKLEANFGVETGPVQHNWKNPDRISKGSKGFPTGGNTRTMGGGQG